MPTPRRAPHEEAPAEDISATVRNGTRVTGLAARAAAVLEASGVTVTGTATASSQDHRTTVIEYGPGREAEARTLARLLGTGELRSTTGGGLDVVLGQSYADQAPGTSTGADSATASPAPSEVPHGGRRGGAHGGRGPLRRTVVRVIRRVADELDHAGPYRSVPGLS